MMPENWRRLYPRLHTQLLEDGMPVGFPKAQREIERELDDETIQRAVRSTADYIGRLSSNLLKLEYEEFMLLIQLAEEACVMEGTGMIRSNKDREKILAGLKAAFSSWMDLLQEEAQRERRAAYFKQWPLNAVLAQST